MKVIVLAGGSDQIALIQELRKRGVGQIILVDYFDNPPAKPYVDKHVVASTLDADAVKKIALEEYADLVCTACTDQALLTVARVSDELSLPCYISYDKALKVTNKLYMKEVMKKNNIPTSKYVILDKYDEAQLSSFSFPLVVKPVDCNSSKGVKKVYGKDELVKYLQEAIELSRTHTAIVEEFKEGDEISADFYVEGKEVKYLCATSSVKIRNEHSFTICGSVYPAVQPQDEIFLTQIAQQIVDAFELNNCPLLIQLIFKDGCFNVIEFSARMGGGSKYQLIETLTGVNIMASYVDLLLGKKSAVSPKKMKNYAKMNFVYCKPGVISAFKGFEEVKDRGLIVDYFFYKTRGMEITKCETSGDRAAGYLVVAGDERELEEKMQMVDALISVCNQDGADMMWHLDNNSAIRFGTDE